MARQVIVVDVSTAPELARLAEQVHASGRPMHLRRGDTELAVLAPVRHRRPRAKSISQADRSAARSAFGGWKDVIDPEELKRILAQMQSDDRTMPRQ